MAYFGLQPLQSTYLTDYFSGNGSTVAFTLSRAPIAAESVLVHISGVKQHASTYGVAGTTLTFSAAPPTGTNNIEVLHLGIAPETVTLPSYRTVTEFTATAGQTTFSPASYTAGYIDVYRNGVKLGADDFTATNGTTVVLDNACTGGDLVRFESFLITSFNNAIPNTAGAVGSSLLASGSALANIGAGGVTQSYIGNNVAGTGPAFSAYPNSDTAINNAWTKINYALELFDTNSLFSSSRFTPNIAGYYQINAVTLMNAVVNQATAIYVNGNQYKRGTYDSGNSSGVSGLVYLNGTTDYAEIYVYVPGSASVAGDNRTWFDGFLVRAA